LFLSNYYIIAKIFIFYLIDKTILSVPLKLSTHIYRIAGHQTEDCTLRRFNISIADSYSKGKQSANNRSRKTMETEGGVDQ